METEITVKNDCRWYDIKMPSGTIMRKISQWYIEIEYPSGEKIVRATRDYNKPGYSNWENNVSTALLCSPEEIINYIKYKNSQA